MNGIGGGGPHGSCVFLYLHFELEKSHDKKLKTIFLAVWVANPVSKGVFFSCLAVQSFPESLHVVFPPFHTLPIPSLGHQYSPWLNCSLRVRDKDFPLIPFPSPFPSLIVTTFSCLRTTDDP